ncbi:polyphosphate kinase 1 [Methylacidimicrobium tartarophylax]|uniref:Polyphosphate kinase n=1 Tax=Methylacidimicrobium tartarophylax TaxID=1041768 RepID=A0A5E6ME02_9BACT|nr:polyphosphate kinase 1 [Methylacidimicrobium tartarophylax]VVM07333.1 polyphosphate kinase [Methylacidimicrobium tartarophylax]
MPLDLANPAYYINRELSWLEFNARVLEEAADASQPLLERLRFLCIFSSNLDEFFEIRVAGIKQQVENQSDQEGPDGLSPQEVFEAIQKRAHQLVARQYEIWRQEVEPLLRKNGILLCQRNDLTAEEREWAERYFTNEILPVLTPLAVDPSHPFPQVTNKSFNLIVTLRRPVSAHLAGFEIVQVPHNLPRLLTLPGSGPNRYRFTQLKEVIGLCLGSLFPGDEISDINGFRVTRNSDLYIDDEEAENLLQTVEEELRKRNRGNAVRLEIEESCPPEMEAFLLRALALKQADSYRHFEPLSFLHLLPVCSHEAFPQLRDRPWTPVIPKDLASHSDIFDILRRRDILLHHPFESFSLIVDLLQRAADDPGVLGIRMTLYRTGGDSPIVRALIRAAQNGKQVTALVEIKARFDEANNIVWARQMEEAGVHVVYGLLGLKTHCKMLEIIRRDPDRIRLYVHLGTGNYHTGTARLYTDLSLLTAREDLTKEVGTLFNILTGLSRFHGVHKLLVAPFQMAEAFHNLVATETAFARQGKPARIIAKMNALVDEEMIQALYRASAAGVRIDLIVRGICCLRPGIPGVSEHIRVVSIVGRFLEHSRIFYFANNGEPKIYLSSADWMPRNFYRRIEVAFPVEDPDIKKRLTNEILETYLSDCVKARVLQPDGSYLRLKPSAGKSPMQAQYHLRHLARAQLVFERPQDPGKISIVPQQRPTLPSPTESVSPVPEEPDLF